MGSGSVCLCAHSKYPLRLCLAIVLIGQPLALGTCKLLMMEISAAASATTLLRGGVKVKEYLKHHHER